jgi:hypothetical protein
MSRNHNLHTLPNKKPKKVQFNEKAIKNNKNSRNFRRKPSKSSKPAEEPEESEEKAGKDMTTNEKIEKIENVLANYKKKIKSNRNPALYVSYKELQHKALQGNKHAINALEYFYSSNIYSNNDLSWNAIRAAIKNTQTKYNMAIKLQNTSIPSNSSIPSTLSIPSNLSTSSTLSNSSISSTLSNSSNSSTSSTLSNSSTSSTLSKFNINYLIIATIIGVILAIVIPFVTNNGFRNENENEKDHTVPIVESLIFLYVAISLIIFIAIIFIANKFIGKIFTS